MGRVGVSGLGVSDTLHCRWSISDPLFSIALLSLFFSSSLVPCGGLFVTKLLVPVGSNHVPRWHTSGYLEREVGKQEGWEGGVGGRRRGCYIAGNGSKKWPCFLVMIAPGRGGRGTDFNWERGARRCRTFPSGSSLMLALIAELQRAWSGQRRGWCPSCRGLSGDKTGFISTRCLRPTPLALAPLVVSTLCV